MASTLSLGRRRATPQGQPGARILRPDPRLVQNGSWRWRVQRMSEGVPSKLSEGVPSKLRSRRSRPLARSLVIEIMATSDIKWVICDIDGVLLHENAPIDGAPGFIHGLREREVPFLLLTNYPSQTPADLRHRFQQAGIEVEESHFYTSTMATAAFLEKQAGRRAFVIGEGALTHALYNVGFTITDQNPDFVVVGETRAYNWEMIHRAARLIRNGARFIATNPDVASPDAEPGCGALCAPIERITGKLPFYVGKPSPWVMRAALNSMNAHSEQSVIVGDNMRTDILAGTQAGMKTILVRSGVTLDSELDLFPYQPTHIFDNVGAIDVLP